jgi:hypothetical protein
LVKIRTLRKASRVALYVRVSTLNGQYPELQLSELREYAGRRGWKITDEYIDQGVSGSKESRPELNQLMAYAHWRKFDAVLVWKGQWTSDRGTASFDRAESNYNPVPECKERRFFSANGWSGRLTARFRRRLTPAICRCLPL